MASGHFPFTRQDDDELGLRLDKIIKDLQAWRGELWELDNDQLDNAADDAHYEAYIELAIELLTRCLEKEQCTPN